MLAAPWGVPSRLMDMWNASELPVAAHKVASAGVPDVGAGGGGGGGGGGDSGRPGVGRAAGMDCKGCVAESAGALVLIGTSLRVARRGGAGRWL